MYNVYSNNKKHTEKIISLCVYLQIISAGGAQVWFGIPYRLSHPAAFSAASQEWVPRTNDSNVMRV